MVAEHADPADAPSRLLHEGHRCLACHLCYLCLSQVFTYYSCWQFNSWHVEKISKKFTCIVAWWSLRLSTPCLTFPRVEPGISNELTLGKNFPFAYRGVTRWRLEERFSCLHAHRSWNRDQVKWKKMKQGPGEMIKDENLETLRNDENGFAYIANKQVFRWSWWIGSAGSSFLSSSLSLSRRSGKRSKDEAPFVRVIGLWLIWCESWP